MKSISRSKTRYFKGLSSCSRGKIFCSIIELCILFFMYHTKSDLRWLHHNASLICIKSYVFHQQHYTVKDLEVLAECTCNGLQTDCVQSNLTRQYECVCGQNSEGKYCEKCKPFYNQQAFSYGQQCERKGTISMISNTLNRFFY